MNFSNILSHISAVDPEVFERTSQRRSVIKNWMRGVTLATLPFALGSLFNKAYGKNTATITEALNFALLLEFFEYEFYALALDASVASATPLIPSGLEQISFGHILNHEKRHVDFLRITIDSSGNTPIPKPNFDFTGGNGGPAGKYPNVFSDYDVFLTLAQTFEDLGVRAYKTGLSTLMTENDILTAAVRIHSTEARHAAHVRAIRRNTPSSRVDGDVKPWVTRNFSNVSGTDMDLAYLNEDNTLQGTIQINGINGQAPVDLDAATESFDEPMTSADILKFLDPFIMP
jgi:hypothetical protein